ncbi:hypothetical protein [Streptomyces candidus]|uniref:Uncharacterized protein n=1 Tax=Streptomyces candidus TaxID=67283 RepID=A0A7X0HLB3_9ACTN|nr:hypothetical protein [Streptomyces candidus]MBB6439779.1 hypothetical protein [Streptomyces candidus]
MSITLRAFVCRALLCSSLFVTALTVHAVTADTATAHDRVLASVSGTTIQPLPQGDNGWW